MYGLIYGKLKNKTPAMETYTYLKAVSKKKDEDVKNTEAELEWAKKQDTEQGKIMQENLEKALEENKEEAKKAEEKMNNAKPASGSTKEDTTTKDTTKKEITSVTPNDIITYGNNFINSGKDKANANIDPKNLQTLSSTVYNVLLITGIVAALIIGMILGIKFIIGSVEEQAEIKKALVPYIVGCVVVFGAFAIWKIVVNVLQSV